MRELKGFERGDNYLWRKGNLDKGREREREMEVIMLVWDMRGEEGDKCMGESSGLRLVINRVLVIEKIEREG